MVESAKREALDYENYSINSYNFQDENSIRIDPYTMFLHATRRNKQDTRQHLK